jgi:hypothetical protein
MPAKLTNKKRDCFSVHKAPVSLGRGHRPNPQTRSFRIPEEREQQVPVGQRPLEVEGLAVGHQALPAEDAHHIQHHRHHLHPQQTPHTHISARPTREGHGAHGEPSLSPSLTNGKGKRTYRQPWHGLHPVQHGLGVVLDLPVHVKRPQRRDGLEELCKPGRGVDGGW